MGQDEVKGTGAQVVGQGNLTRILMNAGDRERHDRPDVHDYVFLNCPHEHVRENGHGHVHGYEPSQNRDYVDEYDDVDVRASLS